MAVSSIKKQKEDSFSPLPAMWSYLPTTKMPESLDLAIFVLTDRWQSDRTNYFTPCACAQGKMRVVCETVTYYCGIVPVWWLETSFPHLAGEDAGRSWEGGLLTWVLAAFWIFNAKKFCLHINFKDIYMNHVSILKKNLPFSLYLGLGGHLWKWKNPTVTKVDWKATVHTYHYFYNVMFI